MILPLFALDNASGSVGLIEVTVTAPISWTTSATGWGVLEVFVLKLQRVRQTKCWNEKWLRWVKI
jgi:hypothetical protein